MKTIVKNYLTKEKILSKSLKQGIRYDMIRSKDTLEFIAKVKRVKEGKDMRQVFDKCIANQTVINKNREQTVV